MFKSRPANIDYSPHEQYFYHSIDLKNGETFKGDWDLRGKFEQYTGHTDLSEKSVIDVGTASGFLAFEAEKTCKNCTAIDLPINGSWDVVPYAKKNLNSDKINDRAYVDKCLSEAMQSRDEETRRTSIDSMRKGFWYAHLKNESNVRLYESAVYDVKPDIGFHDTAIFGSILLHLRDPFRALQTVTRHVRQEVIVADLYHESLEKDNSKEFLEFLPNAKRQQPNNAWWRVKTSTVQEMLQILGFKTKHFSVSDYKFKDKERPVFTLVAERVKF